MSEEVTPIFNADQLRAYMEREARMWGNLVRSRRSDLGMTLVQAASLAGTTAQSLHKIEAGEIAPRDHLRVALAFALATEVDKLFPMPRRETVLRELGAVPA